MHDLFLVLASFLASAVEMVEALTIVLAAGVTRGWRSSLIGVGAGLLVLAIITAALGPALTLIPIHLLQLFVGTLLLIFGLQWLRKAILRAGGFKALHDEDEIFQREVAAAQGQGAVGKGLDWYAFTLCFKGVLLEGPGSGFYRCYIRRLSEPGGVGGVGCGIRSDRCAHYGSPVT
jgi:uncharacterized membrane protein